MQRSTAATSAHVALASCNPFAALIPVDRSSAQRAHVRAILYGADRRAALASEVHLTGAFCAARKVYVRVRVCVSLLINLAAVDRTSSRARSYHTVCLFREPLLVAALLVALVAL